MYSVLLQTPGGSTTGDIAIIATVITASVGVVAAIIAAVFGLMGLIYKERSDRKKWEETFKLETEKWERTLAFEREKWQHNVSLEELRFSHEKLNWAQDHIQALEMKLHEKRLQTYPGLLTSLIALSRHNIQELTSSNALELATKLNTWGYGEIGLCMLAGTREALFVLRDRYRDYAMNATNPNDVVNLSQMRDALTSARDDLIELMRLDLGHSPSPYYTGSAHDAISEIRTQILSDMGIRVDHVRN
jgi:hypothetical protein